MQQITIVPIDKGLRTDRTAFNIDNDSFPVLNNAYQWRGRVKRKRGTSKLGRGRRYFTVTAAYTSLTSVPLVGGAVNIFTAFGLQEDANIELGTLTIINITNPQTYTDPLEDGVLVGNLGGSGTVNYATGDITIAGGGGDSITVTMFYFPNLPIMGLEDLNLSPDQNPGTLAFDTKYSYNINTSSPYLITDVSFYKNHDTSALYPGYTPKTVWTPTIWNGEDYQQFWTVNYEGALWATNGVHVPFDTNNIGMSFKPVIQTTIAVAGPPAQVNFSILNHGLEVGDFLFMNEFNIANITGINFQTGYVDLIIDPNNVRVTFPNATVGGAVPLGTTGIAQYLTRQADTTLDGIRWYDGSPTDSAGTGFNLGKGWVNFSPPLSQDNYSIAELPQAQYYLAGAKMIIPYKDRLLFLGPVVQTSSNQKYYLRDTIVFSQNGTPYYTASYTNSPNAALDTPTSPTNQYNPILVPDNKTATPNAYFEDSTGFGGFISAGISQALTTVDDNGDLLITGFEDDIQAKVIYSGNDVQPFNFFIIANEFGSSSTFSVINMGKGVITKSSRGYVLTGPNECNRIDIPIPDQVFQVKLTENGNERFTAQRDYINEWIYFTYPINSTDYKFPTQTLQYNYADNSWAIFYESYTTYGQFKKRTGYTWATIGNTFATWAKWNEPWNAGSTTLLQPEVIAGNQQGFIVFRDDGTNEAESLTIKSFSGNEVTSPNHSLNNGDYIIITDCIGTISTEVNDKIFLVYNATDDTFRLNPSIGAGTYSGNGLITRMYKPLIQSKQFPIFWAQGRKIRLGPQQYLFTTTDQGQVQLLIFLSQASQNPYNVGTIVPSPSSINKGLVYSTVLFTCTESCNLGLTPSNTNLQMISMINPTGDDASSPQDNIWHRMNTSLIGDTVQIGFTLSDEQMRDIEFKSQFEEIELHAINLTASPGPMLA